MEAHVGKDAMHYCKLLTVDTGYSWSSNSQFLNRPAAAGRTRMGKYQYNNWKVQQCTATEVVWTMERRVQTSAGGGCEAQMLLPQFDWNTG